MSYGWKECGSVLFQPADKILYGDLCGQSRVFHVAVPLGFLVPTPKKLTNKLTFALCCCYCAKADDCSLCFFIGWAHVVCALYIPEVEFANVSTMEPIVLQSVPHERYNKVT